MTIRLSISSFAGIARTLVAVGTSRLASMFVTVRAAAPRRRCTSTSLLVSGLLAVAGGTSRGRGPLGAVVRGAGALPGETGGVPDAGAGAAAGVRPSGLGEPGVADSDDAGAGVAGVGAGTEAEAGAAWEGWLGAGTVRGAPFCEVFCEPADWVVFGELADWVVICATPGPTSFTGAAKSDVPLDDVCPCGVSDRW